LRAGMVALVNERKALGDLTPLGSSEIPRLRRR